MQSKVLAPLIFLQLTALSSLALGQNPQLSPNLPQVVKGNDRGQGATSSASTTGTPNDQGARDDANGDTAKAQEDQGARGYRPANENKKAESASGGPSDTSRAPSGSSRS